MDEPKLEIFAKSRTNLVKIYEILKCCEKIPMSMNQIRNCAIISSSGNILEIVTYLLSTGVLTEITPMEYKERVGAPPRTGVYFETNERGTNVIQTFESFLDLLGFKELRQRRFSRRS